VYLRCLCFATSRGYGRVVWSVSSVSPDFFLAVENSRHLDGVVYSLHRCGVGCFYLTFFPFSIHPYPVSRPSSFSSPFAFFAVMNAGSLCCLKLKLVQDRGCSLSVQYVTSSSLPTPQTLACASLRIVDTAQPYLRDL